MARAHSIWIIRDKRNKILMGAWTVKHEMVTWVERNIKWRSIDAYELWRFRDNDPGYKTCVPWETIR